MAQAALREKYLDRLDCLITSGNDILASIGRHTQHRYSQDVLGNRRQLPPVATYSVDYSAYIEWFTNCRVIVEQLLNGNPSLQEISSCFRSPKVNPRYVEHGLGALRSLKDNLSAGLLDDLEWSVAAAISFDYVQLAEHFLSEGTTGKFDRVPAAVLAGAVLERYLRQLCKRQKPAVSCVNAKGEPLTLNPLIDGLKKAGVFNEAKAKQLRAWADIRNHAAHGEFDQFSREDVELMVQGVGGFLTESGGRSV